MKINAKSKVMRPVGQVNGVAMKGACMYNDWIHYSTGNSISKEATSWDGKAGREGGGKQGGRKPSIQVESSDLKKHEAPIPYSSRGMTRYSSEHGGIVILAVEISMLVQVYEKGLNEKLTQ